MDIASILGFSLFATIAAFTPGPNNLMLAASGANFGLNRTLPHILGITTGFLLLVLLACFGLASLFAALPNVMEAARWFSLLFLLFLAYKIATAAPPEGIEATKQPNQLYTSHDVSDHQSKGDYSYHLFCYDLCQPGRKPVYRNFSYHAYFCVCDHHLNPVMGLYRKPVWPAIKKPSAFANIQFHDGRLAGVQPCTGQLYSVVGASVSSVSKLAGEQISINSRSSLWVTSRCLMPGGCRTDEPSRKVISPWPSYSNTTQPFRM